METGHEVARKYGYTLRSSLCGDFLNRGSDDLMKISPDGEITLYAHDAEAYYVACLIRAQKESTKQ